MSGSDSSLIGRMIAEPLWRAEDLGAPIPPSTHAVSVALPTWRDNVGYEEGDPNVVDRLRAGYPRFVYHPLCRTLFAECLTRWGRPDEACLAFSTAASAGRFVEWMAQRAGSEVRVIDVAACGVHAVFFPKVHAGEAKSFWQHSGEGVSSRRAEAVLQAWGVVCPSNPEGIDAGDGPRAKTQLRERIARVVGVSPEFVWLFPCGMNAGFQLHRVLLDLAPDRRSVQFGFPYVDTLKIQEKRGPGALFFRRADADDLARLSATVASEPVSAVYTEFPSNPLLASPDLAALSELSRQYDFPLVIDDTVASALNVDLLQVADVVWMSLTKYFSGTGDVTGGAVIVNPRSRYAARIVSRLSGTFDDLLFDADAVALERNSRDLESRMRKVNANAEALADFLKEHPRVETVYFPKYRTPELYRRYLRPGAGYGGLLSLDLKDAERCAPQFFDALRVCKGPNLGMGYTLACPYTILAHYGELDFAESCGVSRWLVRVSVGIEEPEELIGRFDRALTAAGI
ncbi:MAG: PLP-dependent transferase [Planctomycetaceae bacterium]|nr:PLP-dependent transferase [Planctomycetaceae bacterium]